MSIFLILLAAGDSKRLKSSTPKPYHMINNKTLLEHSFYSFSNFAEIKKTVLVFNKKHKKFIDKLSFKNTFKITIHKPIYIGETEKEKNEIEIMTKIHNLINNWINHNPESWLWQHNRFS